MVENMIGFKIITQFQKVCQKKHKRHYWSKQWFQNSNLLPKEVDNAPDMNAAVDLEDNADGEQH